MCSVLHQGLPLGIARHLGNGIMGPERVGVVENQYGVREVLVQ